MSYSKSDLVKYRIERAKETYEDSKLLIREERWNSAANRLYYSIYYMISSYFVKQEIIVTTHNGVKTKFNQEMVKTGKLSREFGSIFNRLYAMRQEADYEDFQKIGKEDIEELYPKVEELLKKVEALI